MSGITMLCLAIGVIIFIIGGYSIWAYTKNKFKYNIFGLDVIIKGFLGSAGLFVTMAIYNSHKIFALVLLVISLLMWLWIFINTLRKTNLLVALAAIVYQFTIGLVVLDIVLKILKFFTGNSKERKFKV